MNAEKNIPTAIQLIARARTFLARSPEINGRPEITQWMVDSGDFMLKVHADMVVEDIDNNSYPNDIDLYTKFLEDIGDQPEDEKNIEPGDDEITRGGLPFEDDDPGELQENEYFENGGSSVPDIGEERL